MMSVRIPAAFILKQNPIPGAVRLLTVPHAQKDGRRVEGKNNTKKHYDTTSTSPSSVHSEFDPKRSSKFHVNTKSPSDHAPHVATSGDYSRLGSRTTEYSSVDQKEPYSPPGGEHRYGGTNSYEWNAEKIQEESKKEGKDA